VEKTRRNGVTASEKTLTEILRSMIVERQRLLIREANYLRGLVGLPPVGVVRSVEKTEEKPR